MDQNQKGSTKAGCILGNVVAAVMIFFGVILLLLLMRPQARFLGQFQSGNYFLSFIIALAFLIGGILIIRRNCRKMKAMDHSGKHADGSNSFTIHYCPSCGKKLRIPTGKGRLEVTCPHCRTKFQDFT